MDNQREKGEGERHEESEIRKESAEMSRKEKRKAMKKLKRKHIRKEIAAKEREETEAKLNDPAEQERLKAVEEEEARIREKEIKDFEDSERAWREAMEIKKKKEEEEEAKREEEDKRWKDLEELRKLEACGGDDECDKEDDGEYEYIEEGPPEIIFQGNEIILRKKKVRVLKKPVAQAVDRPTSNPLPPGTEVFPNYQNGSSAQHILDNVAQEVPNFGTEQDKAHCPFHLKTGTCRFGPRCSRVHFYPDKSCTLLLKNMYNGPGIAWEQDEGLEVCNRCHLVMLRHWWIPFSGGASVHDYNLIWVGVAVDFFVSYLIDTLAYTEEEAERCYEEFYEDVHTEFLKFGELINFKVCRNGSFHLKGNVYVHYRSLESAMLAYQSINGRYFAGKQVNCEFVNISRWRVAICGEYIKSRLKTCSRGSACNFIHCFRNPGGDYEWADYDKPPPRFWIHKMTALFGYSDEYLQHMEREYSGSLSDRRSDLPTDSHRQPSTRSKSRDHDHVKVGSIPSYRSYNNHGDTREESFRGHKLSRHDENSHDGDETSSRTRDGSSEREVYKERRYAEDTSHHESKWSEHSPGHRVIRKRIHGMYSDDDSPDADEYDRRKMAHKRKARRGTDSEVQEQVDDEKDIRTHGSSRKHRREGSSADQEERHKHDKVHAVSDKLRRERSKHRHERSSSRYSHEEDSTESRHHTHKGSDKPRDSDRSRRGKRYQRSSVNGSSGSSSGEERSYREETQKERSSRHKKRRSSQHSQNQILKESEEDEVETDRWRPE